MARRPIPQPELFDWTPPQPVVRFEERAVRAASIAGRLCRGISEALSDSPHSRAEIARKISEFLGEDVGENMLNAYASPARETHVINVVRFIGLIHATQDRRLLELVAGMFGWAVVPEKYLPLIEVAAIRAEEDKLRARREALMRQSRQDGAL